MSQCAVLWSVTGRAGVSSARILSYCSDSVKVKSSKVKLGYIIVRSKA